MLVSKKWLDEYVEGLPNGKKIAEALTMHSFEIESVEEKDGDEVIDAKILPNRSHDCLCHRGIAKEVSAIFGKKFTERNTDSDVKSEAESKLEIKIDDPKLCRRYIGKRVENISIKDSPKWLKEKLEVLGERSICNIVDITNYVMLDLGQPMHAFDADKVKGAIHVRLAKNVEKIGLLGGEEAVLDENDLLIADDDGPLAIAGIKGGLKAEVTEETKNIIFESANFDPVTVRKTSQKINIKNNSSKRFENEISPEIAELAMNYAIKLASETASNEETKNYKTVDIYPRRKNQFVAGISLSEANKILGTKLKEKEVEEILNKTGWQWQKVNPKEKIKEVAGGLFEATYKLGASITFDAPNEFDCSSLTSYIFSRAGIGLPRISVDQYVYSERIKKEDLTLGDLIFTNSNNGKIHYASIEWAKGTKVPEGVDHVGLYLGDDKIMHISRAANKITIEKLSECKHFANPVGYGRVSAINDERFVVTVPVERLDIKTREDLAEEIGRIYGYENIKPELPKTEQEKLEPNENLLKAQKIRLTLADLGYSEVYNYAFVEKGKIEIENPMASNKPFLRDNLKDGIKESLEMNYKNAPFLGLDEIKVFEIGTVFSKDGEQTNVAWGIKNKKEIKIDECNLEEAIKKLKITLPLIESAVGSSLYNLPRSSDIKFHPISQYPFVLRDIAVWTPNGTSEEKVLEIILENAGNLLVRHKLFDRFEKDNRVSYAFNLVFQSQEKTLTDAEINEIMEKITKKLNSKDGWQVR